MYATHNNAALSSAFLAGKPFGKKQRHLEAVDDTGASRKKANSGKRDAKLRAAFDETEHQLRNARMGVWSDDEDSEPFYRD